MTEYDVSAVESDEFPLEILSGSPAELGQDAGRITWANCMKFAEEVGESLNLDYDDVADHFRAYGAWDDEEIEAWSDREMQAMVIQETAARLREIEDGGELNNVYRGDDGRVWIYLGT